MRLLALALASLSLIASPAFAGRLPAVLTGNDVSYPQCNGALPKGAAFGIVGVNGGKASTPNPCFATELAWAKHSAGGTKQPPAAVYVNTGNPGDVYVTDPTQVSYWPKVGDNKFGPCTGGNDVACAYEYGKYMAAKDAVNVKAVDPTIAYTYWLDVETANSWNYDLTTNEADLEGMVDYFTSIGSTVGLYSTSYQWGQIVGSVRLGSVLEGKNSWIPGASSLAGAQANCSSAALTAGGQVTIAQYVSRALDYDFSCI
jgi:hypothetical protein